MLLLDRAYVSMARPGSRNEPLPRCPSLVEATDRFGLSSLLVAFLFSLRRVLDVRRSASKKERVTVGIPFAVPTTFQERYGVLIACLPADLKCNECIEID